MGRHHREPSSVCPGGLGSAHKTGGGWEKVLVGPVSPVLPQGQSDLSALRSSALDLRLPFWPLITPGDLPRPWDGSQLYCAGSLGASASFPGSLHRHPHPALKSLPSPLRLFTDHLEDRHRTLDRMILNLYIHAYLSKSTQCIFFSLQTQCRRTCTFQGHETQLEVNTDHLWIVGSQMIFILPFFIFHCC